MVASVHSDDEEVHVEESEPGEDGYWPALEILNERKHDYLVDWDGINPQTGRAWTPSWTRKAEVTEDLIEVWDAKKAAKKKNGRPASNKQKKSRVPTASTSGKPANRTSRSSRTSLMSSSRATDSPAISLTSDNGSRMSGEPSLGKRKRRSVRNSPADEDPKPALKKQRVHVATSSTYQKSRTRSIRSPKQISRETIYEEGGNDEPTKAAGLDQVSRPPRTLKIGSGSEVIRIGPPRRRKKIAPLPTVATSPPSHGLSSAFRYSRQEEEEDTQEAAGIVAQLSPSPLAMRKKKRRLKPASDVRPKPPMLTVRTSPVPPSRDEPQEPSDQDEPLEADPPLPDQDDEPAEPLTEPTPLRTTRQQSPPDSPVDDDIPTPTSPRTNINALRPVSRLDLSPHLPVADTTSLIDEFSPKKPLPTQDTIESPVYDSQVRRSGTKSLPQSLDPGPADDPLDVDTVQEMQDVQDTYLDFDGQAGGVPNREQPTTDPGSVEQDPPRSQSPTEPTNGAILVRSFSSQKLEDALVILNQKSEEIEVLESRLAAQEAQIEHQQAENYRIQVECERLSVAQAVQREALEEANGTVSEFGVHIDWLQGLLDKTEAEAKQLQNDVNEIQDALNTKVEEYDLARAEWEQERAALEAHAAAFEDGTSQQPPAVWELEKKELEEKLAEVMEQRDQLDKDKRRVENEVETWKEQYRKEFVRSQELRGEAMEAKAENNQIREEKAIVASQTKEAVKLVATKYEAVVEMLRKELAKAESLHQVLQAKDEQTGDNVRKRAVLATHLQDEVRRLREELASETAKKATRATELKHEGNYACQFFVNGVTCDQGFDSPQELWSHIMNGHIPSRGQQ